MGTDACMGILPYDEFPAPGTVPDDTDEAFRTFLATQAFEVLEQILQKQKDDLTTAVAHLPQHVQDQGGTGNEGGEERPSELMQQLEDLQYFLDRVYQQIKAVRTALQRGTVPDADDENPWANFEAAHDLQRAVNDWNVACHEVMSCYSEELRDLILQGAQVIFSTTTVGGRAKLWRQRIPTVIVDEACQCRELETMVVMRRHVQRLILVGDPEQYRMLPLIADFPNSAFYNGEVVNDDAKLQFSMKKGPNKAANAGPVHKETTMSVQDAFLKTLHGRDLEIARSLGCASQEELDIEKRKLEERKAKAEIAQKKNLRDNEWKRQCEINYEKEQRQKQREESKWKKQLEDAKKKAFSQGVLEAYDYGDGVWWVQLQDKKWMEVQGRYYCEYCNKHLNDNTLEAHIDSEAHKKKHAWATPALAGPPAPPPVAAPRGPAPAPPLTASLSPVCPPVAHLLDWQQVGPDGLVRCIPCNKVVDDNHIGTGDHCRRLEAWREYERLKKTGHPAPELEYLAWVPSIDGDPNSEKWKKCLLCKKWVQDETSHCGTAANPQGSKEHQKNLRNYMGTAWYTENVIKLRKQYHPEPNVRSSSYPAAGPASPAPWAKTPAPALANAAPPIHATPPTQTVPRAKAAPPGFMPATPFLTVQPVPDDPWALPAEEVHQAAPQAPWDTYCAKPTQVQPPFPPSPTRLPSETEVGEVEEC
ncbi:unnamed protein product [Durusdinium trenchii]|uniref:DNA2/NAM7 helicase helicase domain-containing protein n=1 Tax=Durusdinium trenchii TaxID=1381693 RepID=A0ABP0JR43_9DINO